MIFWTLFIPIIALFLILYFSYIDVLFSGKKRAYLIEGNEAKAPDSSEIKNTVVNLVVFAIFGALLDLSISKGITQIYSGPPKTLVDFLFLFATFFIALALHDVYFYWTHRLLHTQLLFKKVHVYHHQSHQPNAWSAFSFHPIEGIIQIAIVPLVAFILPVHEWVLMLFTAFLLFISVYGHCGYELRPNKLNAFNVFNTSLHHYQHHKYVHYNFGIYLNLWDKLFKTDHPTYESSFKKLAEQINEKRSLKTSNC